MQFNDTVVYQTGRASMFWIQMGKSLQMGKIHYDISMLLSTLKHGCGVVQHVYWVS